MQEDYQGIEKELMDNKIANLKMQITLMEFAEKK